MVVAVMTGDRLPSTAENVFGAEWASSHLGANTIITVFLIMSGDKSRVEPYGGLPVAH